ncbi:MAG: hypothetical protein RLZZ444_4480, partial [Pseudomonadota bacterium]
GHQKRGEGVDELIQSCHGVPLPFNNL